MTETKLTQPQRNLLRLILRSPDIGEGWRQVGNMLWPHVIEHRHPDLTEIDEAAQRIRLSEKGKTVVEFLL